MSAGTGILQLRAQAACLIALAAAGCSLSTTPVAPPRPSPQPPPPLHGCWQRLTGHAYGILDASDPGVYAAGNGLSYRDGQLLVSMMLNPNNPVYGPNLEANVRSLEQDFGIRVERQVAARSQGQDTALLLAWVPTSRLCALAIDGRVYVVHDPVEPALVGSPTPRP